MCLTMQIRPSSEEAILSAAFELLARNAGASLTEIAERAGVGRATLHRHFASREALLLACARAAIAELDAAVNEAIAPANSYTEGLRLALEAMVPLGDRFLFLSQDLLDRDAAIASKSRADRAELVADVTKAQAEGGFAPHLPPDWIASAYEAMLYAAWEMVRDGLATPTQAADFAWCALTEGLSGDTT